MSTDPIQVEIHPSTARLLVALAALAEAGVGWTSDCEDRAWNEQVRLARFNAAVASKTWADAGGPDQARAELAPATRNLLTSVAVFAAISGEVSPYRSALAGRLNMHRTAWAAMGYPDLDLDESEKVAA